MTTCFECDALATVRDAWGVQRCSTHHSLEYAATDGRIDR
jgi:hypothetical protein